MKAIAAVSENWGIGKDNALLFHISEDMKNFRRLTEGGVVIMGRKTLESFPGQKPLPKRINIVITRNKNYEKENAVIVNSPEDAVKKAQSYGKEIFVIGGGEIYARLLDECDECIITKVSSQADADAFFPDLDKDPRWTVVHQSEPMQDNAAEFKFVTYRRN